MTCRSRPARTSSQRSSPVYSPMLSTVGRFWMVTLLSSLASVTAATRGPPTPVNASPRCTPLRLKRSTPLARSMPTVSTSPFLKAPANSSSRPLNRRSPSLCSAQPQPASPTHLDVSMPGAATPTQMPSGPRLSKITWNSWQPWSAYRMVPVTVDADALLLLVAVRQLEDSSRSAPRPTVSHSMSASVRGVRLSGSV
ncbi:MAG: hypothetical protein J3K34DRAFT_435356 [Monoraphidium minutum]|nr:MAG: hypothetical protein J3K34DRAFT_435356 [Monoraphidium minutum]